MTPLAWRMVDIASRALERRERDIVLGDFEELGTPGGHALREVLGLALRRQAARWREWGPWLALAGVVLPLGALLSLVSRWWADVSAIDAVVWLQNGQWSYLSFPGWRRDLIRVAGRRLLDFAALLGWSWTCGLMVGTLSRRTSWINGLVFCAIVFAATFSIPTIARAGNAAVFSQFFYSSVFPVLLRIGLVIVPTLWGVRQGARGKTLSGLHAILLLTAVTALTLLQSRRIQASLVYDSRGLVGVPPNLDNPLFALFPYLTVWPATYLAVVAGWRRWRVQ